MQYIQLINSIIQPITYIMKEMTSSLVLKNFIENYWGFTRLIENVAAVNHIPLGYYNFRETGNTTELYTCLDGLKLAPYLYQKYTIAQSSEKNNILVTKKLCHVGEFESDKKSLGECQKRNEDIKKELDSISSKHFKHLEERNKGDAIIEKYNNSWTGWGYNINNVIEKRNAENTMVGETFRAWHALKNEAELLGVTIKSHETNIESSKKEIRSIEDKRNDLENSHNRTMAGISMAEAVLNGARAKNKIDTLGLKDGVKSGLTWSAYMFSAVQAYDNYKNHIFASQFIKQNEKENDKDSAAKNIPFYQ